MVVINLCNQSRENLKLDLVSEVSLFSMVKETHTLQFVVLNYNFNLNSIITRSQLKLGQLGPGFSWIMIILDHDKANIILPF